MVDEIYVKYSCWNILYFLYIIYIRSVIIQLLYQITENNSLVWMSVHFNAHSTHIISVITIFVNHTGWINHSPTWKIVFVLQIYAGLPLVELGKNWHIRLYYYLISKCTVYVCSAKTTTCDVGNQGLGLWQAQTCGS